MPFSSEKDKVLIIGYTPASFIEHDDRTYPAVVHRIPVKVVVIIRHYIY